MIATCPSCEKRYRLPDDAIPLAGRSVKCAACGNQWLALPPPVEREPSLPFGPVAARSDAPHAATLQPLAAPHHIPHAPAPDPALAPDRAAIIDEAPAPTIGAYRQRPAESDPGARRWRWIVPLVLIVVAIVGVAVVEFAPETTFDPPRLGLPDPAEFGLQPIDPAAIDPRNIVLPALPSFELRPLDLTKLPVIGTRLDLLLHPLPAPLSPLTITVAGERRHLANGGAVLVLAGKIVNPTDAPQSVPPIEARLIDPAGKVALRWRIAAPVATLPPHHEVGFNSTAANYPADAERLDLAFAR